MKPTQTCDLVLEGGGVKGIGLVGAINVLGKKGYSFRRVAGTSAGAIVGALAAAGMSPEQMQQELYNTDYRRFRDEGVIDKLGLVGLGASLTFEKGIYEGRYLRNWLSERLGELGVRTFADLKITEPWAEKLPPQQRYKLVVLAADVTKGRFVRLPWDYANYNMDPDKQLVADAVRASMSIPFFYEPVKLNRSLLVDGSILSNFPIAIFDDESDIATIGIKLSAKPEANGTNIESNPTNNTVQLGLAVLNTMLNAHDQMHLEDPCVVNRTIFVDTGEIKPIHFDISKKEQTFLYENGRKAAREFMTTWDYDKYKKECLKTKK